METYNTANREKEPQEWEIEQAYRIAGQLLRRSQYDRRQAGILRGDEVLEEMEEIETSETVMVKKMVENLVSTFEKPDRDPEMDIFQN